MNSGNIIINLCHEPAQVSVNANVRSLPVLRIKCSKGRVATYGFCPECHPISYDNYSYKEETAYIKAIQLHNVVAREAASVGLKREVDRIWDTISSEYLRLFPNAVCPEMVLAYMGPIFKEANY